jgi:hypothetical protein
MWAFFLVAIAIAVGLWRDAGARARAVKDLRAFDPFATEPPLGSHRTRAAVLAHATRSFEPRPAAALVNRQPSPVNVDWLASPRSADPDISRAPKPPAKLVHPRSPRPKTRR